MENAHPFRGVGIRSGAPRAALAALALLAGSACRGVDPRDDIGEWLQDVPPELVEHLPRELQPGVPIGLPDGPVSRGPYLQLGTPTSVVVRWCTWLPTDSQVWYGTDPARLTSSAGSAASTQDHEVPLTGLEPDTSYWYAVGTSAGPLAGGDGAHVFRTAPEPGSRRPFRAWILGDSGTATLGADAVRDAYLEFAGDVPTDLWLMLGDNAYSDGTQEQYQRAVFNVYPQVLRTAVLWPTFGNHDAGSARSATQSGPYYDIFTLPTAGEAGGLPSGTEAYYSFDHAGVHFVCLDSQGSDVTPGNAMLTWLEQDLAATAQDWLVAFWHHPPYSKGSHDSDTEGRLAIMRKNVVPILEDGGVDLVLCGHSHSYERSFLLDGHYGRSHTLTEAMAVDRGDGRLGGDGAYEKPAGLVPHAGAVYVVAGSSGQRSGGPLDHPVMVVSLNELGSVILDVDGDRLDLRFLNADGTVDDHVTLLKGAPADGAPIARSP